MDAVIDQIGQKVSEGGRISDEDALFLYEKASLHDLGRLANVVRERKNGNRASYVINRYLNYSNVCILNCQFCAFARKKRDADAFEYSIEELVKAARESVDAGITELHIVGGLHPTLSGEYYLDMLRELKGVSAGLHLKVFTAIEIRHLAARVFRKSLAETLELLRDAGLGSLTGGGAEIFNAEVRDQICRGKETAEEWLEVHRLWHQMGGRSTCTMLFGHVETFAHRIEHLRLLRGLQDESVQAGNDGGFSAFIPFAFEPDHNSLSHIRRASPTSELRNLAVARLYLDNIDHITAYWISMGLPLAQVALSYGVDDLHGTIFDERIFHMAGATTPLEQKVQSLKAAILEAGREPVQRDSFYQSVRAGGAVPA